MKPDLKATRIKLEDPDDNEQVRDIALSLLAYAEKLEAVALLIVEDRVHEYDEPVRDALRAAGWEV